MYNEAAESLDGSQPSVPKESTPENLVSSTSSAPNSLMRCFGCGVLGYSRTKCPTCRKPASRPLVKVTINNYVETARLETGSEISVASPELRRFLKNSGVSFYEKHNVLACTVRVTLKKLTRNMELVVLPETRGNVTILGLDFLVGMGVEISVPQGTWNFVDDPRERYDYDCPEVVADNESGQGNESEVELENVTENNSLFRKQMDVLFQKVFDDFEQWRNVNVSGHPEDGGSSSKSINLG